MSMLARARADLVALQPYASARRAGFDARIRLDANESPWDDAPTRINRYPVPQPDELRERIGTLYRVGVDHLWIGRGSDEAIDLLLRAFCRAEHDNVVAHAPSFGMYGVGARIQGVEYRALELSAHDDFALDPDRLFALTDPDTKLAIVCSPNNPTGSLHHGDALVRLAGRLAGRALLVLDEAYIEFAGIASAISLIERHDNVVVLRTLSKAHGLAGARVGALIARPEIVDLIGRIAAPYPLPTPSVVAALGALEPAALERSAFRVAATVAERERVAVVLRDLPDVRCVWPSAGNFLLVRFADARSAFLRAFAAGVLVRDVSSQSGLADCLRISIGRPDDNDALLAALVGNPS
jgi:histidinol-phosphate aminotransferase